MDRTIQILWVLEDGPKSAVQIAAETDIRIHTVAGVLKSLLQQGRVRRIGGLQDARVYFYKLVKRTD